MRQHSEAEMGFRTLMPACVFSSVVHALSVQMLASSPVAPVPAPAPAPSAFLPLHKHGDLHLE